MDFFTLFTLIIIFFVVFTLCGFCCRRSTSEGTVFTAPVVVQQTNTGPYPVTVQGDPNIPGGGVYPPTQPPYPPTGGMPQPYPPASGMPQPYPPTGGMSQPYSTAYPPMPQPQTGGYPPMPTPGQSYPPYNASTTPYPPTGSNAAPTIQPPTYEQAVGGESYQKQSAYNPNYSVN